MSRAVIVLLLAALATPAAAARPRVASASLCADQYVLKLADPDQIAMVSRDAHDPWVSLLHDQAAAYPAVSPSAEAYLRAGVEVVVASVWSDGATLALLERFGVRVARIPLTHTFTEVEDITATIADALGHPERGAALNADIRRRLAALPRPGNGRDALYLRPGGGSAGRGTFVDATLRRVGLGNWLDRRGARGWTSIDIERLQLASPDVVATSFFETPRRGFRRMFAAHPALRRKLAALPVVAAPGADWVCGAWILIEAAEALARALDETQ